MDSNHTATHTPGIGTTVKDDTGRQVSFVWDDAFLGTLVNLIEVGGTPGLGVRFLVRQDTWSQADINELGSRLLNHDDPDSLPQSAAEVRTFDFLR